MGIKSHLYYYKLSQNYKIEHLQDKNNKRKNYKSIYYINNL